jgi:hypothetical protein
MTTSQAYNTRAVVAYDMHKHGYTLNEVAQVLRLRSREDVRKLIGRAERLRRLPAARVVEMTGANTKGREPRAE